VFDAFMVLLVPDQSGALWIGALIVLVVLGDFDRWSPAGTSSCRACL
jgi:hypothetical protein